MPRSKSRKGLSPETLRKLADLERRARETDKRIAETLKRADRVQRRLQEIAAQG